MTTDTIEFVAGPASADSIKLGYTLRDAITGFTGIAIASVASLTGTKQYFLQPKGTDESTIPEAQGMDWQRLDVVDAGVSARFVPPEPSSIGMGQEVVSKVNAFRGKVIEISVSLAGCIRLSVESEHAMNGNVVGKEGTGRICTADHKEWEVVGEGVSKTVVAEPTGGPSMKMRSRYNN